ncbi:MAG TPA: cbb3-type cytochrome oxidase assembly protein CcoS [Moraxellaceae bacterium]
MEVIYFLVPLSLLFLAAGVWVFFWAVKSRQFDDMEGPAHRIVMDDRDERRQRQRQDADD